MHTAVNEHSFAAYTNPKLARVLGQLEIARTYVRGEGCYLFDSSGVRYLDFLAQYGALPFGFNHPAIWAAVDAMRQSDEPTLVQPSMLDAAGELARRLVRAAPPGMRYATFANSGAEAVEAAIKLCRSATGRAGILAASNGFHGKTLGALSATDKKRYQQPFGAPVPGFQYVPFGDATRLGELLADRSYAAFIVEPVQGEGGIIEAPPGYLAQAAEICRATGTLLVVDEIQTGLGRTGRMFACEAEGVQPEVITVAKALGGGIVPVGACIYREEVYNEEFALNHTSTFAGNTLACRVGLATLDLLEAHGQQLINEVAKHGAYLKQNLLGFHRRYPDLIESVRGRGYMLGVKFGISREKWGGSLLACLGETEFFSAIVVSHILNFHRVRLGYTLNQGGVIRVEPPLTAGREECDLFLAAFENTLAALERRNTAAFTAHLTGLDCQNGATAPAITPLPHVARREGDGRFAFLFHPLTIDNYADVDSSLSVLSKPQLRKLAECVSENFDPFVVGDATIVSPSGRSAFGEFIVVPRTAEELMRLPHRDAVAEVKAAAEMARQRGARIIGLGGYTSVVTLGGLYLKNLGLPALTTGNSYTAMAGMESVVAALATQERTLTGCCVSVVGATGSIGRAFSLLIAPHATRLALIGNPAHPAESRRRLLNIVAEILRSVVEIGRAGSEFDPDTIGAVVFSLYSDRGAHSPAEWMELAQDFECRSGCILACCDTAPLRYSDVIVTATSAVGEIVKAIDLAPGAVVCDISRPPNINPEVKASRPDVRFLDGGVIQLPEGGRLSFRIDLPPGFVYACMAETMILALDGRYEDTSLGLDLDLSRVRELAAVAAHHGFQVAACGETGGKRETYELPRNGTRDTAGLPTFS
jgi:acetylornithine/succinyldiaminopimelate/putrescine aminotransferase/predicted amino acid dehydrogenase